MLWGEVGGSRGVLRYLKVASANLSPRWAFVIDCHVLFKQLSCLKCDMYIDNDTIMISDKKRIPFSIFAFKTPWLLKTPLKCDISIDN